MRFPIDGAFRIGYGFGYRGNIGVPGASTNHEGIDIIRPDGPLPRGTPVHAILPGKVLIAGNSGGGAGYTTLTEHPYQGGLIRARINHYSRWDVSAGQTIQEGHVLGLSGGQVGLPGAGSSGGGHCHVGIYKIVNGRPVAIDPGPFFGLGSTVGVGYARPGINFPAFAGGDATPFEEDDMTPEQATQLDAIYKALFGPNNGPAKTTQPLRWADIGGTAKNARYGALDVLIYNQQLIAQQAGKISGLADAVSQLQGGGQVNMGQVTAAAEAGARDALARLTISIED